MTTSNFDSKSNNNNSFSQSYHISDRNGNYIAHSFLKGQTSAEALVKFVASKIINDLRKAIKRLKNLINRKTRRWVRGFRYPNRTRSFTATNKFLGAPSSLREKHEDEFRCSAIAPEYWANFPTVEGNKAILDYLLVGDVPRTNTGRVDSATLRKYASLHSGWLVETEGSDFCQFKPDEPRYCADGTPIKYESPEKHVCDVIRLKHLPRRLTKPFDKPYWDYVNSGECGSVYLPEGAKKAAAMLSLGLPAIGLTGIHNIRETSGGKPIPALLDAVRHKKEVIIVFDAPDKLSSIPALKIAYRNLKNVILAENPGCEVKMLYWDWHLGKGVDDLIFNHPKLFEAKNLKNTLEEMTVPFYEGISLLDKNLPAFKRITDRRYLSLDDVDNFQHKYTAMKAAKDSGKTQIISQLTKAQDNNQPIVNPVHRISLGMFLADRLHTYYHNDTRPGRGKRNHKLTACINSLSVKNCNPENFKNAIIIFDEFVQFCDFLLSGTIKDAPAIFYNLEQILRSAKQIIIADADLDYKSLACLDRLMSGCNFLKEVKIYEFKKDVVKMPMTIHIASTRKVAGAVYERALEALVAGEKILVMVDSASYDSKLGCQNLKDALEKGYFEATGKEIKGLALYAQATKNISKDASKVVTKGVNVIYEYDFVVYTTVIGTGVSLDKDISEKLPVFNRVLGGFCGSITIDNILQGLHRYRYPVPREVFIPKTGMAARYKGYSYSAYENAANTRIIKKEVLALLASYITPQDEREGEGFNLPLLHYYSEMMAFLKYECDNFLEQFKKKASKDYVITWHNKPVETAVPSVLEETVEENIEKYQEEVVNAKIIENFARETEIKAASVVSHKDAINEIKTAFAKKYGLEHYEALVTPELMQLDRDRNYLSGIRNHYNISRLDQVRKRSAKNIESELLDFEKFPRDTYVKTKLLIELGATKLIESTNEVLSRLSPLTQEIAANYQRIDNECPGVLVRHLGLKFNDENPMDLMDSLALKFAMKRKGAGRVKLPNGERISQIKYLIDDKERYQNFKVWDETHEYYSIKDLIKFTEAESTELYEKIRSSDTNPDELIEFNAMKKDNAELTITLENQLKVITEKWEMMAQEYNIVRVSNDEIKTEIDAKLADEKQAIAENVTIEEYRQNVNDKKEILSKFSVENCVHKFTKAEWIQAVGDALNCLRWEATEIINRMIAEALNEFQDLDVVTKLNDMLTS